MRNSFALICSILLITACAPSHYKPGSVQYGLLPVNAKYAPSDSAMAGFIGQYSKKVEATMNDIIGRTEESIDKKQDVNELGYFMADAYLQQAAKVYGQPVDIAFMNNGGIRKLNMGPGNISMGTIYELMPFDNILILLKLTGEQTEALLNLQGGKSGVSLSGATYTMRNKKAENIVIGGKPFDRSKTYTVALSDYMANGGDDCKMLIGIPQINNGYLQRDAIIDYVRSLTASHVAITAPKEPRVIVEQ